MALASPAGGDPVRRAPSSRSGPGPGRSRLEFRTLAERAFDPVCRGDLARDRGSIGGSIEPFAESAADASCQQAARVADGAAGGISALLHAGICSCPSASAGRAPRPEQPAMVTRWPLAASAVSSMDPGFTVRAGDGRRFGRWACLVAPMLARQQGVTRHIGDRRSCAGRLGHRKDRAAPLN